MVESLAKLIDKSKQLEISYIVSVLDSFENDLKSINNLKNNSNTLNLSLQPKGDRLTPELY